MRKIMLLMLTLVIGLVSARGENESDYELKIGSFNKIKIVDNVNVVYQSNTDSVGYVCFRTTKALSDVFLVSNNNGTLKIETRELTPTETNLPTLYIYSEFLSEAHNYSDSTLFIRSVAPSASFKAVQMGNGRIMVDGVRCTEVKAKLNTGNGTITLNGQCTNAKFSMLGTGLIQADDLKSDNVWCSILGSGSIGCWPRFDLNVKGIGSTKIYYRGNPQIKKRGGGKLFRLESTDEDPDYDNVPQ